MHSHTRWRRNARLALAGLLLLALAAVLTRGRALLEWLPGKTRFAPRLKDIPGAEGIQ